MINNFDNDYDNNEYDNSIIIAILITITIMMITIATLAGAPGPRSGSPIGRTEKGR